METILAAAVTGLLGLFAVTVAGLLGLFAGVHLERERSKEWAKKERWAYKRETYEEAFDLLAEIVWWLPEQHEQLPDHMERDKQRDKQMRKLSGLLFRMRVFLNEEARQAIEDYEKRKETTIEEARDAVLVLADKLVIAARPDLDFRG